jgi:restriction system protein
MALKMHENSLFAVLMRSPWWVSLLVGAGLFALIRVWLNWIYALFAAMPFLVIAGYVGWKQLRQPSRETILKRLEKIRALPPEEFARQLEAAFRREGYGVARLERQPVDFELSKGGRVAWDRWRSWRCCARSRRPTSASTSPRARCRSRPDSTLSRRTSSS